MTRWRFVCVKAVIFWCIDLFYFYYAIKDYFFVCKASSNNFIISNIINISYFNIDEVFDLYRRSICKSYCMCFGIHVISSGASIYRCI